jgi:hypothetical protein
VAVALIVRLVTLPGSTDVFSKMVKKSADGNRQGANPDYDRIIYGSLTAVGSVQPFDHPVHGFN